MPDLPTSMNVIAIRSPGGPEVLAMEQRPMPQPVAGEILVAVAASGLNRMDISQRRGNYPLPPGASDIPGVEVAGRIVAAGAGATRFPLGTQVCGLVTGGGYADYCVVPEANALPVPAGLSLIEAGALPEALFTVWSNVFDRGGLKAGETFLVHGGSSGIGTTAIMLAKASGAFVLTTAGSAEKCAACRRLGADVAIDYKQEDFVAAVKAATAGRGADLILDMVGGSYVARNYEAAARDARIVQIATLDGAQATIDLRLISAKRLWHTGSGLRGRPVAEKAAIAEALAAKVWPMIEDGRFRPVIDSTFPIADVARAHQRMESSAHIGKIVLTT